MKRYIKTTSNTLDRGYIWERYRKPHGNWTDDLYDKAEDEFGLRGIDFRASNMQSLLKVADKLGVEYVVDGNDVTVTLDAVGDEIEGSDIFVQLAGDKRCCHWDREDYSDDLTSLTMHFTK